MYSIIFRDLSYSNAPFIHLNICLLLFYRVVSTKEFFLLCLIKSHYRSDFSLIKLVQQMILQSVSIVYSLIWRWHRLFPKGRFGVVLHVFISCTMKNFQINLTLFQWMRDLKSSNMFASIIIKGYHFFICFKVGSFCAIVLGHFPSDFLWKWASFVFFLNWYTQSIAVLINEIFDKSIIYNLW